MLDDRIRNGGFDDGTPIAAPCPAPRNRLGLAGWLAGRARTQRSLAVWAASRPPAEDQQRIRTLPNARLLSLTLLTLGPTTPDRRERQPIGLRARNKGGASGVPGPKELVRSRLA